MTGTEHKPVKIFCSYSHKDEAFLDELKMSLVGLRRQRLIKEWYDREILPGQEWEKTIDENLRTADIVLLLVTPTFMNSDYVYEKELNRALERHKQGEARVIPIIVRPSDWEWAFGHLQALPKDAKPISRWPDRDEAWLDVVKGIRKAVKELTEGSEWVPKKEKENSSDISGGQVIELMPSESSTAHYPSTRIEVAGPNTYTMGETATLGSGDEITVYSYESPVPEPGHKEAKLNYEFSVIDIQACASPNSATQLEYINPFDFALQMPDNTRLKPEEQHVEGELTHIPLPPGDCVRGRVFFQIPQSTIPKFVIFSRATFGKKSLVVKWAIDGN